jgi:hypothetical protein
MQEEYIVTEDTRIRFNYFQEYLKIHNRKIVPIIESPELCKSEIELLLADPFVMLHRSLTFALKDS